MSAYYNEIDPYAAEWLRNLIKAGHIADGIVDTRSISDIEPYDLREFTQCHFFAGIGVWSLALRLSGWPDDRPVWTGSCPCQPFSSAGRSGGFADERHLWPHWHHLIRERRPAVVFGEQVASKAVEPWIDLVHTDLEALGYAFGAIPFPAASVGAPHIRDRLYWMADSQGNGYKRTRQFNKPSGWNGTTYSRADGGMGDSSDTRLQERIGIDGVPCRAAGTSQRQAAVGAGIHAGRLADAGSGGRFGRQGVPPGGIDDGAHAGWIEGHDGSVGNGEACIPRTEPTGPVNGFWAAADWLLCRDGKWRPVESGTFPLAHGAPARVGRLRAYGNAINAEAAVQFIGAYLDAVAVGDLL